MPTSSFTNMRRSLVASLAAAAALIGAASIAAAGPINPPAGPVAPTMKTLDEIEARTPISSLPFTITQPGSYYLTGNLTGVVGLHGITVNANDVTIDLNGFTLRGIAGSSTGILASTRTNVHVRNGRVMDWGGVGVHLGARGRLEGVSAVSNTSNGAVLSSHAIVTDCRFHFNGVNGLIVDPGSTVSGTVASNNGSHGFSFGSTCSFSDCTAMSNGGTGFSGPSVGSAAVITNCTASSNTLDGFDPHVDSVLTGCAARSNGRHGYNLASNSRIYGCTATFNTEHGIRVGGAHNIVERCTVVANGGGVGGTLAGILVVSSRNRIENNISNSNARGIEATSGNNIFIGNTAGSNGTNYVMANGNAILVVSATTTGAFSGSSGGSSPGSTNPFANFSY